MLDHGLRDHGLDLVFGGALIGAPAFSRTLVGDPTLLDDGPACGRALFRRLVGTADAAAVLVPTAIGLTAGRAIPRLLERGTAARTWPWTGTPV